MTTAAVPIPADALAAASLDRLDTLAAAMERKWGIDRLPRLVEAALAVRFRSQAERLDEAIRANRPEAISVQAEAMVRAWLALDKAALGAGHAPLSPVVWETVLPNSGEVVAIVRDADEAGLIAKDRVGQVFTLAEVAIAIEAFGETVRATKRAFPGAEVTAVRSATKPASLAIGSRPNSSAPVVADRRETKMFGGQPARNRRTRSAGAAGVYAPLFDPRPDQPPSKPTTPKEPFDWSRGDDIPF